MAENDEQKEIDCGFQWDDNSQLYYHASTGFYHDPQAGWYYCSSDGLYYKFEDGNYVPLDSNQAGDQTEMHDYNCQGETSEAQIEEKEVSMEPYLDSAECTTTDNQSEYPPPPSEWLEETLINMYLSGYPNQTTSADMTMSVETNGTDELNVSDHEAGGGDGDDDDNDDDDDDDDDDDQELEEGEWIPDDPDFWRNLDEKIVDEGVSHEEENWRAQYGQVSQLDEELADCPSVDLWDWALVKGTKKDGKTPVARLVGRLRKRSSKLHPSVPSGGGTLKTAPVCEVHFDMVRVTSGRIYRLRIPSLQYVSSISAYNASNPTKDWGFPQLSIMNHTEKLSRNDQQSESQGLNDILGVQKDKSSPLMKIKKDPIYRDRAAERRALHGGFGVGPGQKNPLGDPDSLPSLAPEEAAAESLNISFGEGSYARKLMEGMGWKEGETLGSSMTGLTEPLKATGNKGTAGLGWNDGRRNK